MNLFVLLFFVFGLAVGSFLNVVVFRLREAETLLGRSFCRHCHSKISFYDNIPLVSYILLAGKCRECKQKISWQYPLLEGITAFLFATGAYFFSPAVSAYTWLELVWVLGLISMLLVICFYDLQYMEVSVTLLIFSALWNVLFLFLFSYPEGFDMGSRLVSGLIGGGLVTLFFFALVYASKETWMGWGDVWLGGVAGMTVGLPYVLFMLTLSFGIGAIISLASIALGKKGMKSQVPFAPFLVIGTILTIFLPVIAPDFMRLFFL